MENFKSEKILINEQVGIINDTINSLVKMGTIDPIRFNCEEESELIEKMLQVKANYEDMIDKFNLRNKKYCSENSLSALPITEPSSKENLIEGLKIDQSQFTEILSELDDGPSLNASSIAMEFTGSNALGLEKGDLAEQTLKTQQLHALRDLAVELDNQGC